MFCSECGNEVNEKAIVCPNCGVPTEKGKKQIEKPTEYIEPKIGRGWAAIASLLIVGLGQMLQGRVGRGLAWLLGGIVIGIITMGIGAPIVWIAAAVDAYIWKAYDVPATVE